MSVVVCGGVDKNSWHPLYQAAASLQLSRSRKFPLRAANEKYFSKSLKVAEDPHLTLYYAHAA